MLSSFYKSNMGYDAEVVVQIKIMWSGHSLCLILIAEKVEDKEYIYI